jgi:hypothetical protein
MSGEDRLDFLQWVEDGLNREWEKGQEKYQSHILGFQGTPLDHAIEEALNILCYLWIEKRRQGEKES